MDNWGCLLLYRKKLVLPRVYQLVDWFSWLACFFAILFIASIVYRYGFTVTEEVHSVLDSVSNAVWIVFLINTTLSHLFSNDSSAKFTVWTWLLDVCLYLTLLPAVLLLAGTLIILLFEWNNAFSGMDTADKVVHASVDDNNYVFKFAVPAKLVVYKISELNSEQEFRLRIISVVMGKQTSNFFGISKKEYVSTIDYSEDYDLKEEDGLVCYGRYSDFMKFWKSVK